MQNGGENFTKSLTILLRNSYLLGYFPKCWKQDNRICIKKSDKANYHLPNLYRSISISNFLGKIYEKIIQQEAINVLTENYFLMEKMSLPIKKIRTHLKHYFHS